MVLASWMREGATYPTLPPPSPLFEALPPIGGGLDAFLALDAVTHKDWRALRRHLWSILRCHCRCPRSPRRATRLYRGGGEVTATTVTARPRSLRRGRGRRFVKTFGVGRGGIPAGEGARGEGAGGGGWPDAPPFHGGRWPAGRGCATPLDEPDAPPPMRPRVVAQNGGHVGGGRVGRG